MSSFKVPVTTIKEINPHPNADRLAIAKIYDWNVIVGKDQHSVGEQVVYVPVDSILPEELENRIFGADSKVKLNKHRVKSIKLRGEVSQGLVISWEDSHLGDVTAYNLEEDVAEILEIKKYEPPIKDLPSHMQVKKKKKFGNSNFKKYTNIENFKYYNRTLQDDEQVYISEKLHGTSFRAGWFKSEANTIWKKIKKIFGKLPEWEFCYGSREVEISSRINYSGYYGEDIYGKIVHQEDLKNKIPVGMAVYGEIVGDNIQKNYNYGCKQGQHKLFVYDVMDTNEHRWLDYPQFVRETNKMVLARVPMLYVGVWSKTIGDSLRDGPTAVTDGNQPIREGVVIRPVVERKTGSLNRVILKYISEAYYLQKDNSEFH